MNILLKFKNVVAKYWPEIAKTVLPKSLSTRYSYWLMTFTQQNAILGVGTMPDQAYARQPFILERY